MSWLEDYNGPGVRWWHVVLLLLPIISFVVYMSFFAERASIV
jgi:hypothetical protein